MNRKEATELLPIIKAFAEGKVIQVKDNNVWEDIDNNHNCVFLPDSYEYRIKPESNYRPFKGAEECWEEMQKHHPFGWIKPKDDFIINKFMFIDTLRDEGVTVRTDVRFNYYELVKRYTFADGTPLGILEEE